MSETVTATSNQVDALLSTKDAVAQVTDTFGKQSTTSPGNNSAVKDAEISTGTLPESTTVRVGDSIQLAAKSPDGEMGRARFIVDAATKQKLLVAPPVPDGSSSEIATFIIAPVGGAAKGSELSFNQLFTLHVADAAGNVLSINSNPPGMPEAIGLQEAGLKGEMTFTFVKPKDNSKIQFNDSGLVLSCTDANRTRKNFNNHVTLLAKKSKQAKAPTFLTTSLKKGPAITFTVARPNVVPAARESYRDIAEIRSETDTRSEAKTVEVSEVGAAPFRESGSFTTAINSPLPITPMDSFADAIPYDDGDGSSATYVPPAVTLSPASSPAKTSTAATNARPNSGSAPSSATNSFKDIPLAPKAHDDTLFQGLSLQPTTVHTFKQDSAGDDVVHMHGKSPAIHDSLATKSRDSLKSAVHPHPAKNGKALSDDEDDDGGAPPPCDPWRRSHQKGNRVAVTMSSRFRLFSSSRERVVVGMEYADVGTVVLSCSFFMNMDGDAPWIAVGAKESAAREGFAVHSPRNSSDATVKVVPHAAVSPAKSTMSLLKEDQHGKWLGDSVQELSEIQQSVDRLKMQRLQVEHIRHENERLEAELAKKERESVDLRDEVTRLEGVEVENERLRSRVLHVESKLERLDAAYREKREALEDALETRVALETRWNEATTTLQRMVDETTRTYEHKLKLMEDELEKRTAKIAQLHERLDESKAKAANYEAKLERATQRMEALHGDMEKKTSVHVSTLEREKRDLGDDLLAAEKKIAALTGTATRQKTMIHECHRVITESEARMKEFLKRKNAVAKAQADLEAEKKELESQLKLQQVETGHEMDTLKAANKRLEAKIALKERRIAEMDEMLAEVDKKSEMSQQEFVKRERHRFHLDEQNKELLKREKKMQCDVTELSMALRDAADEKRILAERVQSLQGTPQMRCVHDIIPDQLEIERHDRAKWASTRLKLLAQFCDEENKLTSTLNIPHHQHHASSSTAVFRMHNGSD
ncbi:Aste57867_16833 [Aphanomyces stellatus]|uniref:Aste57867_16833 protein n=1 Tax=Aphanomyces stellatus TaxID=120398 RepID=A0A485L755_9STRA|nr:hypothetical protein As57867_016775 [Aphanomyces stellatus]VFT93597.1 Aste57867_16833 [Aphanomyces stellatus]